MTEDARFAMEEYERLCDRLAELKDAIPRMQEKADELERSKAAEEYLEAERDYRSADHEMQDILHDIESATAAIDAAERQGDEEEADRLRYRLIFFGERRGYRLAPYERAARRFQEAQGRGLFTSVEEASDAHLDTAEEARIDAAIRAYQDEYQRTLDRCMELDRELFGDGD